MKSVQTKSQKGPKRRSLCPSGVGLHPFSDTLGVLTNPEAL